LLIAVCTYRRPEGLSNLLASLADLPLPPGVSAEVLVVDNDPERSARVPERTGSLTVRLQRVGATNIAVARNVVLDAADGFDLLAMIDDDELPRSGWVTGLVRSMELHDCDIVIGRVRASLPAGSPDWLTRHYEVDHGADGRTLTEGISGNALLDVRAVRATGVRFEPGLGISGGEDQCFFRQLSRHGLTIRYAAGAVTVEQVPGSRIGPRYLVRRSMRAGNTLGLLDGRLMRRRWSVPKRAVKAAGWTARGTLGMLAALPLIRRAEGRAGATDGLVDFAFGVGMVPGLLGLRQEFYGEHTTWRRMRRPDPAAGPRVSGAPRIAWVLREDPRSRTTGHRRWLGSLLDAATCSTDTVVLLPTRAGLRPWQRDSALQVHSPHLRKWRGRQVGSLAVCTGTAAWWCYEHLPSGVQYAVARARRSRRHATGADHVLGRDFSAPQTAWIREALEVSGAHTVVFDSVFSMIDTPAGMRRIVLSADVVHRRAESFATIGYRTFPPEVGPEWEAQRLGRADAVVSIQWDEARLLESMLPGTPVVTAPPTFPVRCLESAAGAEGADCLFVGNGTAHNVDGLRWLMDEIWPVVHGRTGARLRVVGAVGSQVPPDRPAIDVLGKVADLDGEYARARLVLVPLRAGSGLKIKLAEAICHGRASITTGVGAQGLTRVAPAPFVIADSAADFTERTIEVLQTPSRRAQLEAAARHCARLFDPEHAHRQFLHLLTEPAHRRQEGAR